MSEPKRRRGRPRTIESVTRDDAVLRTLREAGRPLTRNQIAGRMRVDEHLVYLSLWRLREDGRVRRPDRRGLRNHWELT